MFQKFKIQCMFLKHLHICVNSKVYRIELFLNNDFMTRKCSCSVKIRNKFGLLNHSWNIEIEWVSEDQFRNGSKPSSKNAVNHLCHCSNWTVWIWTLINLSVRKRKLRRARKRPRRRRLAGAVLSCHCWRTSFELISVP